MADEMQNYFDTVVPQKKMILSIILSEHLLKAIDNINFFEGKFYLIHLMCPRIIIVMLCNCCYFIIFLLLQNIMNTKECLYWRRFNHLQCSSEYLINFIYYFCITIPYSYVWREYTFLHKAHPLLLLMYISKYFYYFFCSSVLEFFAVH